MSLNAAALKPRSILIATDFSEASETALRWRPVSEKILETADKLQADLIIMGVHDSAYTGIISHLDLATTYDVVCQASSPVLTVSCFSGDDVGPRPTEVTASP